MIIHKGYMVFSLFAVTLCSPAAKADIIFDYTKGSPVSLGRSIDIRLPTETKRDCLDKNDWVWVESEPAAPGAPSGVQSVSVMSEYIEDYRDLFDKLHINASYKGSATIKKAITVGSEGDIDWSSEFTGSYSDISYVLMAQYDFGSRRIKVPALQLPYQQLISEKRYEEFIQICGTHFAVSEERWAHAAIVVNISKLDESMKRRLQIDYKSKADIVKIGSGEFALKAEKEIRSTRRFNIENIKFVADGGDSTKLSKLASATEAADLKLALSAMEEYMTGIARETSAVKSYRMASFEIFGLEVPSSSDVASFMEAVYLSGLRYQKMTESIRERLREAVREPERTVRLREVYERDLYTITSQKAALDQLAVSCVKQGLCDISAIRKVAPRISYTTSLLQHPALQANCLYANGTLAEIAVRLSGQFLDSRAVQDFRIYRIPEFVNGKSQEADVKRTNIAADPNSNRFVASIEYLRDEPMSPLTLPEEARAIRYEMAVTTFDNSTEWYDLGYLNVHADSCPLMR